MTHAELLDLLREARDFMHQAAISRGPCPDCTECDLRDTIIAKADAALAAPEAEERVDSATPVVEWAKNPQTLEWYAKMSPFFVEVHYNNGWKWAVVSSGEAPSEAEAKAAAITAARGMK